MYEHELASVNGIDPNCDKKFTDTLRATVQVKKKKNYKTPDVRYIYPRLG